MTAATRFQILVCDGPSCGMCLDSEALLEHVHTRIAGSPGLQGRVFPISFTCFGRCGEGPNMLVRELSEGEDPQVEPEFTVLEQARGLYLGMDKNRVDRVIDEHCETGQPIEGWAEFL